MKLKIRLKPGQLLSSLWQRFAPSALICLLLTAAAIIFICIDSISPVGLSTACNTFFSYTFASLGMSLLFATTASTLCERYERPQPIAWVAAVLGAGCGALLLWLHEMNLPMNVSMGSITGGIVLCLLALCFHAVSYKDAPSVRLLYTGCWFLAAFGIGCLSAMFLNLCGSAIFALLLQNASYQVQDIFMSIVGITSFLLIAPWVFLGGLAKKDALPDKRTTFFSAFVLLPLYLLFVGILLVYVAKIAITFTMPVGVMNGYSIATLTTFVFFNLTLTGDENPLSVWFKKWGSLLMPPIIITQGISVWMRVSAYGLTETRVLGIIWTLMCIAVVVTAIFRKRANWFFLAAAGVAVVIFCTPLTARNIAVMNQESRLHAVLERNHMIGENNSITANPDVPAADQEIIYSSIEYLENVVNPLKGSFTEQLQSQTEELAKDSEYSRRSSSIKMQLLGFAKPNMAVPESPIVSYSAYCHFYGSANRNRLDVSGYSYAEWLDLGQLATYSEDLGITLTKNDFDRYCTADMNVLLPLLNEQVRTDKPLTINVPVTFMIDGEEIDFAPLLNGISVQYNNPTADATLTEDKLLLPSGKTLHIKELAITDHISDSTCGRVTLTGWLLTPEE